MAAIQKKVSQLALGDIVAADDQPPSVVLATVAPDPSHVVLTLGMMGALPQPDLPRAVNVRWHAEAVVQVERHDLTPAQAVADQLLAAARAHAEALEAQRKEKGLTYEHTNVDYVAELVALNKLLEPLGPPPPPPKVGELLALLHELQTDNEGRAKVHEVLDRARRAGVWPHG